MSLNTLSDLLEDALKDLYNAENQVLKALPKMVKKASAPELQDAFSAHLKETQGQVQRLEKIGKILEIKLSGKKCKAMEGLIEEGKEVLEEEGDEQMIDAALIGAAQRIEHYEIAAYGTTRAFAEQLGHDEVITLLQETLDEEGETNKKLTEVAENAIYPKVNAEGAEA